MLTIYNTLIFQYSCRNVLNIAGKKSWAKIKKQKQNQLGVA